MIDPQYRVLGSANFNLGAAYSGQEVTVRTVIQSGFNSGIGHSLWNTKNDRTKGKNQMKKWLFVGLVALVAAWGLNDYLAQQKQLTKIDQILLSTNASDFQPKLLAAEKELSEIIEHNEHRLLPNFWQEWYLERKLTLLPILQKENRHLEMLQLSQQLYERTNKPFYFRTSCFLQERMEKTDLTCYQTALAEIKKQADYFALPEYWLIATAINDPEMDKNRGKLLNDEKALIEGLLQNRKQTIQQMFP